MITKLFSEQVTAGPPVAALFVLYLARTVIAWARLRQFTGPRWTGVSNIPHGKAALSEKCHEWYAKVSQEHGPIARIAPGILLTSSPEVWAHVNRHAGYKRSEWYYNACRVEYRRDNVFTQSDNVKHEQRRKQMAPGYSGRENPGLEASIDERLEDLLNLVRTKYISTPDRIVPMDLAKKVQFFTLDVISAVGLGKTFGMLAADKDVDSYLQSSEEGLAAANTAWALGASWLAQSPVLGRFIAPSPRDNNGFGKMMATCFRFALYGDDAQAFRPERWFEDDKDKLAAMVRTNDMVFGDGRFTCLGKPVAQMEMAKTIFELLRHFDVALIDPIKPWKTRNLLGLFAISDMWVQVMERS
ncbi:hypothetical protein VdG1_07664 [Verticillium dahliae VDG1]|nr:hypothetical protein VdG1_07664 [Verticillium dahliae VDG1]